MKQMQAPITATVFNIQHYCIHDGPGIRTGVFLKGCPLRCLWCANPESQIAHPQLMYLSDRCIGCGACISVCPKQAISRNPSRPDRVITDRELCLNCGACVQVCPVKARSISGEEMSADEVFREVQKDSLFYGKDGGLTVSGGEAFMYPKFCEALFRMCKEAEMTTAIETCGFVDWSVMKPVLALTDFVLYDVKHMNSNLHKQYTGQHNERIFENLKRISKETDCTIYVRCPVVPPCNDSEENFQALGSFLTENDIRVEEVHLLPYHNLGTGKFAQLETGKDCFESHAPAHETIEHLRDVVRSYGFTVK